MTQGKEMKQVREIKQTDKGFPKLLKEIPKPPKSIYVEGSIPEGSTSCIAIVGTRKATLESCTIAKTIARELAQKRINIVSGLAFGIDRAAHEGALESGGKTYAVLGHGLHTIYPSTHKSLAEKIKRSGGLISEYREGEEPQPYRFLERNRIISGLSLGVIIIEAPKKSGALKTAHDALDQGREVFVIPHSPKNESYAGSLELLRMGARLIRSTEDVLEDLGIECKKESEIVNTSLFSSSIEEKIYSVIKTLGNASVDNLVEKLQINSQVIENTLTDLELKNLVTSKNNNYVCR